MGDKMSSYVTITLTENTFNQVCEIIEQSLLHQTSTFDIIDVVHLIDLLEDERNEYKKENKEWLDYLKYKKMEENEEKPRSILFSKVSEVLSEYGVTTDIPNQEFILTCELCDKIYRLYQEYGDIISEEGELGVSSKIRN